MRATIRGRTRKRGACPDDNGEGEGESGTEFASGAAAVHRCKSCVTSMKVSAAGSARICPFEVLPVPLAAAHFGLATAHFQHASSIFQPRGLLADG